MPQTGFPQAGFAFDRDLDGLLRDVHAAAPTSALVAYCDLDSELTLRHCADSFVPQELMDRLSRHARRSVALLETARALFPDAQADTIPERVPDTAPQIAIWDTAGGLLTVSQASAADTDTGTGTGTEALLCYAPDGEGRDALQAAVAPALCALRGGA